MKLVSRLALAACSIMGTMEAAGAQGASSFFSGKTISFIVASGPGGGYDAYARLLTQYMPKHIPGQPQIVIQYVPGGGGMVAANNIFNLAPKDGTAIALLASSSFLVGALGERLAKFDNLKFTYVGNMSEETDTCSVWHTTGIRGHADFLTKEVIIGTAGVGSNSQTFPMGMNEVLGAKFKLIPGFNGGAHVRTTAMERGELQGTCGIFVSTLNSQLAGPLAEGKLKVVLQMGLTRHPKLPDVPNALELASDATGREVLTLLFGQLALGRPIVAPPDVPKERADLLARAFAATMTDPDFLADAEKLKLETRWFGPDRMQQVMQQMHAAPEPIKVRVRKILNIKLDL